MMVTDAVRERFSIKQQNMAASSRLIKEALESGVIVPYDVGAAPKFMKYIPWWAARARAGT
ncbi:MAG: hypothetical protein HQK57_04990 [Deltaproteobacteria bacterium]|nr:hypothetical protein [Deltaproteobacteria bacterium]MBF0524590.1 hypothetical protein [Deltaproteobacteria bacterium]